SGQEMFSTYCAACHGKDGRGKGPAAPALKTMPTDLTTLTAHNNGKFPEPEIYHAISGDGMTPAHGSVEMPVWGDLFKSLNPGIPFRAPAPSWPASCAHSRTTTPCAVRCCRTRDAERFPFRPRRPARLPWRPPHR